MIKMAQLIHRRNTKLKIGNGYDVEKRGQMVADILDKLDEKIRHTKDHKEYFRIADLIIEYTKLHIKLVEEYNHLPGPSRGGRTSWYGNRRKKNRLSPRGSIPSSRRSSITTSARRSSSSTRKVVWFLEPLVQESNQLSGSLILIIMFGVDF